MIKIKFYYREDIHTEVSWPQVPPVGAQVRLSDGLYRVTEVVWSHGRRSDFLEVWPFIEKIEE